MRTRKLLTGMVVCAAMLPTAPMPVFAQGGGSVQAGSAPGAAATTLEAPGGLHDSIARGDYSSALRSIEGGADLEAKDAGAGASALHFAVMKGRMPMIDLLLSRGANISSRTKNGTTPLHTAVLYARKEVAELLLDNGADINAASTSGATPLALALAARNGPIAQMLVDRGAKETTAAKRMQRH